MYAGPNIERDGLIFGYDTGANPSSNFDHKSQKRRFFKGRNNTNYLSDGLSGYNVVQAANWNGATPTFTLGTSKFGTPIGSYNTSGTSYMYSHDYVLDDDLNTLSGQTVTFSVYLKRDGADSNIRMRIYDNVSGYTYSTKTVTNQFQRYTMTKTLGSSPTRIFVMIDNTGGGVIDFHSPQLEIGPQASPFADGTRSSTDSLIDLNKSTTIDVSNVSFGSDGLPTFDGTDDEINTGITTQLVDFSCVVVFKDEGSGTWGRIVDKSYTTGFFISSRFNSSGAYIGAGIVEPNSPHGQSLTYDSSKYNYFVVTRSGTTHTIYLNGSTNSASKTGSGATLSSTEMAIGAWYGTYNGQRFTGEIPVVKLYNRALTPKEIQQDFKAYKNRFNL